MLTKKLVKLFAKTFANSVELPDTTITYHKGGIVEMSREGLTKYYYFVRTLLLDSETHNLLVAVDDELQHKYKFKGHVLVRLPEVVVTGGSNRLQTDDYMFKSTLRLLTEAIVMDFTAPAPLRLTSDVTQPYYYYTAPNGVLSILENSIRKRVGILDSFINADLSGVYRYFIRDKAWEQSSTDLTIYHHGEFIVATVSKTHDNWDGVKFDYRLCKHYNTNSISELKELVVDVIKAHDSFKELNN